MDNFVEIIGLLLFILFNFLLGMNEKKKKKRNEDLNKNTGNLDIPIEENIIEPEYSETNSFFEKIDEGKKVNEPVKINYELKYEIKQKSNIKRNKVISSLKNKNNLKTAFLLSEILGKPKAFMD